MSIVTLQVGMKNYRDLASQLGKERFISYVWVHPFNREYMLESLPIIDGLPVRLGILYRDKSGETHLAVEGEYLVFNETDIFKCSTEEYEQHHPMVDNKNSD